MKWLVGFLLLAGVGAIFGVGWELYILEGSDPTKLGQRGDFFGGFLNPILTFLGFIAVLVTVMLQRNSMVAQKADGEDQRRATHRQSFESTLFQMLALHITIVDKINVRVSRPDRSGPFSTQDFINPKMITERFEGRDALEYFGKEIHRAVIQNLSNAQDEDNNLEEIFNAEYSRFWRRRRQDLGHYFRFLYNIVRFIHNSEFKDDRNYIRFVRAQLSDFELLLLFYNCLSEHGANFRPLVEEHAILKNIPPDFGIDERLLSKIDKKAFGLPWA